MTTKRINDTIKKLAPWFHNIHLPGGEETAPNHPLGDFPSYKWEVIHPHLPDDLSGHKILDIGCNAGFYTIQCALRGAEVTAIDIDPHYLKQSKWIAGLFNLQDRIKFHKMQVYDLMKYSWKFDLVLFLGVFYHLRYPLLAIDIVSEKVGDTLIFQSLSLNNEKEYEAVEDISLNKKELLLSRGWPSMAFIENKFMGDPTNWWVPNSAAIKALFKTAGLKMIQSPGQEVYFFKRDNNYQPVASSWNKSEFLSATGKEWESTLEYKVGKKTM